MYNECKMSFLEQIPRHSEDINRLHLVCLGATKSEAQKQQFTFLQIQFFPTYIYYNFRFCMTGTRRTYNALIIRLIFTKPHPHIKKVTAHPLCRQQLASSETFKAPVA